MLEIDSPIQPHEMTAVEFAIQHLDKDAAQIAVMASADPNRAGRNGVRPPYWSVDVQMEEAIYQFDKTGTISPPPTAMTRACFQNAILRQSSTTAR